MIWFKRRKDDKSLLKYFLPYGIMRRQLARKYDMIVKNGEFVKSKITAKDISGFHFADIFPLAAVMAYQRLGATEKCVTADPMKSLRAEINKLKIEMKKQNQATLTEIERLTVENMRLAYQLKIIKQHVAEILDNHSCQ